MAEKTYECAVTRNGPDIRVVSKKGGNGVHINRDTAKKKGLTIPQLDLLDKCQTGMVPFTLEEMKALLAIQTKCEPAAIPNPVTPPVKDRPECPMCEGQGGFYVRGAAIPCGDCEGTGYNLKEEKAAAEREARLAAERIEAERIEAERLASEKAMAAEKAAAYRKPINDTNERIANHAMASAAGLDGLEQAELKARRLESAYEQLKGDLFDLTYDIPTNKPEANRNPESQYWKGDFRVYFWRLAFHRQNSGWTFRKKGFEHPYVAEMFDWWKKCGIRKIDVFRVHPDDKETIKNICYRELAEHIANIQQGLLENIDAVSARFQKIRDEANEQGPIDKAETRMDCEMRNHLRNAQTQLENAIECAREFDQTENLDALFAACREIVRGRAIIFNIQMSRKGKKGVE